MLVIIGDEAPDALHGSAIGARSRLLELATAQGMAESVRHLGALDDEQLSLAYAASDVHVFPVREVEGDVEGFGMVAIEAAAYGLPTVAFAVGGVPDAVADGISGYLVKPGDYDAFADCVSQALDGEPRLDRRHIAEFAQAFNWSEFTRRMMKVLDTGAAS